MAPHRSKGHLEYNLVVGIESPKPVKKMVQLLVLGVDHQIRSFGVAAVMEVAIMKADDDDDREVVAVEVLDLGFEVAAVLLNEDRVEVDTAQVDVGDRGQMVDVEPKLMSVVVPDDDVVVVAVAAEAGPADFQNCLELVAQHLQELVDRRSVVQCLHLVEQQQK